MKKASLYSIEKKKIKGKKLGLMLGLVLFLQFFWLLLCFRPPLTSKERLDGYYSLLVNLPTLNTIFFPLLIAVFASRLCEIEHKGNNLKLLYTLMERKKLFDLKFLLGLKYILMIGMIQFGLIFLTARLIGFTGTAPFVSCIWIPVTGILMNTALFLLQEVLSFWFENQMISLSFGLFGSFFGLFSLFIPQIRNATFWSYYLLMSNVNMDWNSKTRVITYYTEAFPWQKVIVVLLTIVLFYCLGSLVVIKKKEV